MNAMLINGISPEIAEKVMGDPEFQNMLNTFANLEQSFKEFSTLNAMQEAMGSKEQGEFIVDPETGKAKLIVTVTPRGPETIGEYTYYCLDKLLYYVESIPNETERAAALFGIQLIAGGPIKTAVAVAKDMLLDAMFSGVKETIVDNVTSFLIAGKSFDSYIDSTYKLPEDCTREEFKASVRESMTGPVEFGLSLVGVVGGVKIKDLAKGIAKNTPDLTGKLSKKALGAVSQ